MTTYSAIADAEIDANSPITTGLMTKLRDNPLAILEGLGLTVTVDTYISPEQTIVAGSTFTLNHLLTSFTPTASIFQVFLVCKSAEFGYSVGDVVVANPKGEVTSSNQGTISIRLTATQIIVRIGGGGLSLPNATTGAETVITAASWRLVISLRG